ncbi:MAG: flagellar basal body rod protein FlgF [Novosphingobium sp.]
MDRLIFTAMSGMTDSMNRQRVLANNMANSETIGFRAELIHSTPVTLKGPALEARAMSDGEVRGADMSAGAVMATGRPLDIAMNGDALLAVQAADGTEAYTRRGDLSISVTGVLENGDGRPVVGASGPITVPPGAQVSIAKDGSVLVANAEDPSQPPEAIDRIKLASPQGSSVSKALDGLFRVVGGGILPADENAEVLPASLEQSNVKPSDMIVQMIQAQRLFDIRTKLIATARDIDQSGTSLMRIS